MRSFVRWFGRLVAMLAAATFALSSVALAQSRVGKDSTTRLERLGRDIAYVTATSFGWAALDQLNDDPPEWGHGWHGYGHRLSSNVGKSVIQETVTAGVAAAMDRPLDYARCRCKDVGVRIRRAVLGAVTDQMADGTRPLAVPRIAGAYTAAYAQASWRPGGNRLQTTLLNGSGSLAIGALINLYYEFK